MKIAPCNILEAARLHETKRIAPFHHSGRLFRCLHLWPAVVCALLTALTCMATNRTWTGSSGIDQNWMTPGNWTNGVAPSAGDNLIFQGVASGGNDTNHNNFPDGTVFGSISISTARGQDFAMGGNRVVLTNGLGGSSIVFGAGGVFVFFDITLSGNQTFTGAGLTLSNTIDTAGYSLMVSNSGGVVIDGNLTNSYYYETNGDSLVKANTGTLTISSSATIGPNGFLDVGLLGGTLAMKGVGYVARFDLDQGSLIVDGTIGGLALNGSGVSISGTGNFAFTYDEFTMGSGTFTPGDNGTPGIMEFDSFAPSVGLGAPSALQIIINGTQPGVGYGQLLVTGNYDLGTGNPLLYSPTELALQWNYAPQLGDSFLVVTNNFPEAYSVASNYFFAGLPPNSIDDATNGASLGVSYNSNGVALTTLRIASSPFVLWKGSILGTNYGSRDWSVINNWGQNAAPAIGDVLVFSPYQMSAYTSTGTLVPIPPVTNDFANGTSLTGLAFTGSNYTVYGNALTVTGGITNNTASGTNFFHLGVATAGVLPLDVESGGSLLMDGVIAGNGTVSKVGGGLLIYTGVTSDAFVGTVAVSNGTLEVDGSFTDGSFTVNGGMLDGTGTVSAVTVNSGTLKAGDSPGILHVQGNLTMAPGATFTAELAGPIPGSGYDQLQVSGSVSLNGATLDLQPNFAASVGAAFIVLVNNGTGAIAGTFAGLPEGAIFQAGGQYFYISYQAGTGNKNVVVTRVNQPGNLTRIEIASSSAVELLGLGGANATYTILANTNLATTNWVVLGTSSANSIGSFFIFDVNTQSNRQRFYKVQRP